MAAPSRDEAGCPNGNAVWDDASGNRRPSSCLEAWLLYSLNAGGQCKRPGKLLRAFSHKLSRTAQPQTVAFMPEATVRLRANMSQTVRQSFQSNLNRHGL